MTPPDVTLYDPATGEKTFTDENPVGEVMQGSMAFSGSDLYAVVREPYNGPRYLWRMDGATLPGSSVTLSAPSTGTALEPLTVTGRLMLADGSDPGPQPVVVTRRLPDGTSSTISGVTTAPDGTFSFTDTPPVGGSIGYTVAWDGDGSVRGSTATATVTVDRHASTLALAGPSTGNAGKPLAFVGAVDPGGPVPPAGSPITVVRTVTNRNGTTTTTLPEVTTTADGAFAFTDTPPAGGSYTYTAQWTGDATFLPTQASATVTVRGAAG